MEGNFPAAFYLDGRPTPVKAMGEARRLRLTQVQTIPDWGSRYDLLGSVCAKIAPPFIVREEIDMTRLNDFAAR